MCTDRQKCLLIELKNKFEHLEDNNKIGTR